MSAEDQQHGEAGRSTPTTSLVRRKAAWKEVLFFCSLIDSFIHLFVYLFVCSFIRSALTVRVQRAQRGLRRWELREGQSPSFCGNDNHTRGSKQ